MAAVSVSFWLQDKLRGRIEAHCSSDNVALQRQTATGVAGETY